MEIKLNSRIYPLEAILNACYSFLNRAYIFLDRNSKGENINITIKGKRRLSKKKLDDLRGEFMNELLHCSLRYQISNNNKKIREYIISRALYSAIFTPMVEDIPKQVDKSSYKDDPLLIAVPWEEKYGAKEKKDV